MSDTKEQTNVISDADELERHLATLEEGLARQLQLAQDEKYDEFIETGQNAAVMLQNVTTSTAPITHVAFETIGRIHKLHRKIGLLLSARNQEMTQKMSQMKTGKSVHRAYRNAVDS